MTDHALGSNPSSVAGGIVAVLYGAAAYVFFLVTFLYAIAFVGNFAVPKTIDSGAAGPVGVAVLVNVLLLGLFAVQHSVMARPAFKRWWTKVVPPSVERSTFVLLATAGAGAAVLAVAADSEPIIWSVSNPFGEMILWAIFWIGWVIVLVSTFLINHFELFGLRQVYARLRGHDAAGGGVQDAAALQVGAAPALSRLPAGVLGDADHDARGICCSRWRPPGTSSSASGSRNAIWWRSSAISIGAIASGCGCCCRCRGGGWSELLVIARHSRSKNGVASLAYGDEAIQRGSCRKLRRSCLRAARAAGLLRFARNDGGYMARAAVKKMETSTSLLEAAKKVLRQNGYAGLSTRDVAAEAGVPLSQIHYHFGSKQNMMLALFEYLNAQLLGRQQALFSDASLKMSEQWERACDYLDEDIASGYVRVLQELIAASWHDVEVAKVIRAGLMGWLELIVAVARKAEATAPGALGPFTPEEAGAFAANCFIGAESLYLLGAEKKGVPVRQVLRRVGDLIRVAEKRVHQCERSEGFRSFEERRSCGIMARMPALDARGVSSDRAARGPGLDDWRICHARKNAGQGRVRYAGRREARLRGLWRWARDDAVHSAVEHRSLAGLQGADPLLLASGFAASPMTGAATASRTGRTT